MKKLCSRDKLNVGCLASLESLDDPRLDLESPSLRGSSLMILAGSDITVMKYNKTQIKTVTDLSSIFKKLEDGIEEALK